MSPKKIYDEVTYQQQLALQQQESLRNACHCARLAEEFRCKEVVVLDLTKITPIADYFVIATATNLRQTSALIEEVRKIFKQRHEALPALEGGDSQTWMLQDFGTVVLHVFVTEARELYDLEGLWADAGRVEWKNLISSGAVQIA
ncbi:MAG: ribosome silencing factor [Planctomyces sp.]|nr:ribosome silencing factor [Planctomyces sp.]